MDWQLATTLAMVGLAGAALLRRAWSVVRAAKGRGPAGSCGSGCGGCGGTTTPADRQPRWRIASQSDGSAGVSVPSAANLSVTATDPGAGFVPLSEVVVRPRR